MVRLAKKLTLLAAMCVVTLAISGCTTPRMLAEGWFWTSYQGGKHFWTTPLIPVPASWSEKVEDAYWEAERYENVPVLDPVEGENAPFFCIDPPSDDEVMRALPDDVTGGMVFVAETSRNNVRIVVEQIVDRMDECKFYPLVGPARLHHCHYKCTVYFDKTIRSSWPVPFTHTDQTKEVVYIDHDHLIRCAGPQTGEFE